MISSLVSRSRRGTGGRSLLENDRLDLAVARGAAYYGMVRRGLGVRIAAGLARSYYIGAATADRTRRRRCALCRPASKRGNRSI